jgi:hypothetical protein
MRIQKSRELMAKEIDVFQDLAIRGPIVEQRRQLRDALISAAIKPWQVDIEESNQIARQTVPPRDVILFRREASDGYPAARLTLWETVDGYYVPNVTPLATGQLTYAQYNAILADFVERVAAPVTNQFGFTITETKPRESVDDWFSPDAALKLKHFSDAANKSTGSSHPMDERRWFEFLVAAHRDKAELSTSKLARWLHEVERWDEDSAHRLAGDFENSLSLLAFYDDN